MPPVVGLVALAGEMNGRLERREARSRGELARSFRLTAARVTQVLGLLRLAPVVLEYVRAPPAGTPARMVTERALRPLTKLSEDVQIERAMRGVPGFAMFVERKKMTT